MFNVLLIYSIVCLLYVYFFLFLRKKDWLVKLLLIVFFPFLGFLLVVPMDKKDRKSKETVNSSPIQLLKKSETNDPILHGVLSERDRNVIPIEDALILNESHVKRKLLLELLKEESIQNMDALKMALENDDTETSHYAASAIMEIKRKLLNAMQSLEMQVEERPNDLAVLSAYSDVMKQYIQSGFLDEKTLLKNLYSYSHIVEKMIEIDPTEVTFFIEKIQTDLVLSEYEKARMYTDLFLDLHPFCEDAYFLDIQLNFELKNQEAFKNSIQRLRDSSVKLSPAGLNKLRFWLG